MTDSAQCWQDSLRLAIPRLLITGGSGFIGTNAVQFALQAGLEIRSIDIRNPQSPPHATVWRRCDLLDVAGLSQVIGEFKPTHVLHLAARTDLRETRHLGGYEANMRGVANLIEALRGSECQRVIFTSSMLVCRNGYCPRADDEYCPDTLYGESKVRGERLVRQHTAGYVWSIARPTSIWGPWFGPPYRQFFLSVARGLYRHPGSVSVKKALGYVGNTVWELYRILAAPSALVSGLTFYVSDYESAITRDWASLIAREFGSAPIKALPLPIMRAAAIVGDIAQALGMQYAPLTSFRLRNMLTSSEFDLTAVERVSGPLPYTMEQGVKATVAWLSTECGRHPSPASGVSLPPKSRAGQSPQSHS